MKTIFLLLLLFPFVVSANTTHLKQDETPTFILRECGVAVFIIHGNLELYPGIERIYPGAIDWIELVNGGNETVLIDYQTKDGCGVSK